MLSKTCKCSLHFDSLHMNSSERCTPVCHQYVADLESDGGWRVQNLESPSKIRRLDRYACLCIVRAVKSCPKLQEKGDLTQSYYKKPYSNAKFTQRKASKTSPNCLITQGLWTYKHINCITISPRMLLQVDKSDGAATAEILIYSVYI